VAPKGVEGQWFAKHHWKWENHDTTIETIKPNDLPIKWKGSGQHHMPLNRENEIESDPQAGFISPNKKYSDGRNSSNNFDTMDVTALSKLTGNN